MADLSNTTFEKEPTSRRGVECETRDVGGSQTGEGTLGGSL